ncbi:MAG: tetratricopeptide repeat protein [Acidobacteriota bacterium]
MNEQTPNMPEEPMNAATQAKPDPSNLPDPIDEACRLHEEAAEAYQAGQVEPAIALFRRALALFEEHEGADHPDVAAVLGSLGAIHENRSEYAAAEEAYARAVQIMDAAQLEEEDADILQLRLEAWANYGRILRIQGRYAEGSPLIRRALSESERLYGADSLQTAYALNDLGMLGKFAGWFDEAAGLYQRALAILEQHHGKDCPESASIYHNLGGLEHARGRFVEGEPFARKSVELRQRARGADHVDVAADVAALAALLDGQERYDESEPLYIALSKSSAVITARSITKSPRTCTTWPPSSRSAGVWPKPKPLIAARWR